MIGGTSLEILISGIAATFTAQLIKFISHYLQYKKIDFKKLASTGGMPSSHSAGVIGLTTSVFLIEGIQSGLFGVSLGFAMVVMYDTAGLRRSAGKMAAVLNRLTDDVYETRERNTSRLKELLGHTPFEVLMGALLGVSIAMAIRMFFI